MSTLLAVMAAAAIAAQDAPPQKSQTPNAKPAAGQSAAPSVAEVVVTGAQAEVRTLIDRRTYSIGKDIQASSGSMADALRNVPGVEVDLQGTLTMRGDANVTIQIDGKLAPAFQGAGRADALQQLPADQIERVEVITTPSAANNPEGSGIINIVMKQSRGGGRTGSVYGTAGTAGLKRTGGSFGYNSKKLSVTGNLSANYQRNKSELQWVRSLPDPVSGQFADHDIFNVGRNLNRTQNGAVNLGYELTPKDHLSAGVSYNAMLLYGSPTNSFTDYDPSGAVVGFQDRINARRFNEIDTGLTGGWKHSFAGDGHTLSVDLIANSARIGDINLWRTTRASPAATPLELNNQFIVFRHQELKPTYVRPDVAGGKLTLGYEFKRDDNDARAEVGRGATLPQIALDPGSTFNIDYLQTIHAAYGTFERPMGDLTVLAGLRLEETRIDMEELTKQVTAQQDYFKAFPSLSLAYKLDDSNKLTFSYSKRIQRPQAGMLVPTRVYIDPKNYQQGNPQLAPQETQSVEAAYEKRRNGAYYLATLYYRQNEGEFTPVATAQPDGVVLLTLANLGSSKAAGIELVANGKFSSKVTYNATGNLFWNQINASNLGIAAGQRSATGVSGRFNVNWQARPNDALQLNLQANGKRLFAQGEMQPIYTVNLGWRHKLNDRVTATVSVQDLFDTNKFRRESETVRLREWLEQKPVTRAVLIRLDYRLGGGGKGGKPAADPAFEYGGAASAP